MIAVTIRTTALSTTAMRGYYPRRVHYGYGAATILVVSTTAMAATILVVSTTAMAATILVVPTALAAISIVAHIIAGSTAKSH